MDGERERVGENGREEIMGSSGREWDKGKESG